MIRPTSIIYSLAASYNHVHNLFYDWANFAFTTSETKCDYYQQTGTRLSHEYYEMSEKSQNFTELLRCA